MLLRGDLPIVSYRVREGLYTYNIAIFIYIYNVYIAICWNITILTFPINEGSQNLIEASDTVLPEITGKNTI